MHRPRSKLFAVQLLACLGAAAPSWAAEPCAGLDAAKQLRRAALLQSTFPYDCCDERLDRCLSQRPVCRLAERLRDAICRALSAGKDDAAIQRMLADRARSLTPGRKAAPIALAGHVAAGAADAKVTVVAYACARCAYCARLVPEMYQLVTAGPLKGKAKLYLKRYPIRGHQGAVPGAMAMAAAERLGKFWPFVLHLYRDFTAFAESKLPAWAAQDGMDAAAFSRLLGDTGLRDALLQSKKEGIQNDVKSTPSFFINGNKYVGPLDRETLIDVIDEVADRLAGNRYSNAPPKRGK